MALVYTTCLLYDWDLGMFYNEPDFKLKAWKLRRSINAT